MSKSSASLCIGLLKEGRVPPDNRVPLTPDQCAGLKARYPGLEIVAETSDVRCFSDREYEQKGIQVTDDLSGCDVLMGVKEVPVDRLMPDKTYLYFSHTIKKQPYNRRMLQTILERHIRLVDYECLTGPGGQRVIAFGRWAGIVGAHNGLRMFGKRTGAFSLPAVHRMPDYKALQEHYRGVKLPSMRIVLTGNGRVAHGAEEVLWQLGIQAVNPADYLNGSFDGPVYTKLSGADLYYRKSDGAYVREEFHEYPERYATRFSHFTACTDLMINAIFWKPDAPVFFTREEMLRPGFSIRCIADISCDIRGSIPSTQRASTIENPVYGYDPATDSEAEPYGKHVVDVMAVDNLPNELPRDASEDFGNMLIGRVIPEFFSDNSLMLERATIARDGHLTTRYSYLQDYVDGKE